MWEAVEVNAMGMRLEMHFEVVLYGVSRSWSFHIWVEIPGAPPPESSIVALGRGNCCVGHEQSLSLLVLSRMILLWLLPHIYHFRTVDIALNLFSQAKLQWIITSPAVSSIHRRINQAQSYICWRETLGDVWLANFYNSFISFWWYRVNSGSNTRSHFSWRSGNKVKKAQWWQPLIFTSHCSQLVATTREGKWKIWSCFRMATSYIPQVNCSFMLNQKLVGKMIPTNHFLINSLSLLYSHCTFMKY